LEDAEARSSRAAGVGGEGEANPSIFLKNEVSGVINENLISLTWVEPPGGLNSFKPQIRTPGQDPGAIKNLWNTPGGGETEGRRRLLPDGFIAVCGGRLQASRTKEE
jgi:hypothetical protein